MALAIRVAGRLVPIPRYLAGISAAKAQPHQLFTGSLRGPGVACGWEIIAQYRADLHKRINERGGWIQLGPRVHPSTWGVVATPRAIIERDRFRSLNRHQRRHIAPRVREE